MIGEVDPKTHEEVNQVKFLGRCIRRNADGYTWEADEKHVKILLEEHGMQECKPLNLPMSREGSDAAVQDRAALPPMELKDATQFRRSAARLNYLALDRPDLAVAVNRLARCMSDPRVGDDIPLKRVLRYLKMHRSVQMRFDFQPENLEICALSDSDWAGCRVSRKSTTGFAVFIGSHLLQFGSKMQKSIALSSGEAELVAQTSAICEGLALGNLLGEFGWKMHISSKCDSSAARGILSRIGVGRIKHLEIRHLWVQDLVQNGQVTVSWIPRARNPADSLTHVSAEFATHMQNLSLQFCTDSALSAMSEGGVADCLCHLTVAVFGSSENRAGAHTPTFHGSGASFVLRFFAL